jgi:GT2 family glycosyltransferase
MTAPAQGISVIVPTCGRMDALLLCLGALERQAPVAGGMQVVVSIDGPSPAPADVRAFAGRLELEIVHADLTGPAGARNRGAAVARAPLLAFVDDDCVPQPGWAVALVAALEGHPDALAGGPVVNAYPRDVAAAAAHAVLEALYACPTEDFLAAANLSLRRERFVELGGFDESFPTAAAEDRDLCARAIDSGMEVVVVPNAAVVHHRPAGPVSLWRQHAEYGRGARRLARLREESGRPPVRAGRRFPRALARATFSAAREAHSPFVVPLVMLTQVAAVWGYATCQTRRRSRISSGL